MPRIVDWPARMREVAEFVGLGEAELAVIQSTSPVILEHGENLTAAVYDHFLKFDDSRRFFLGEDGAAFSGCDSALACFPRRIHLRG